MANAIHKYSPDSVSLPGETLEETLEAMEMTQAELATRMGRPLKTINEIIQGKAAITDDTALQLERVLGISASFWNNRERQYREALARLEEKKQLEGQVGLLEEVPLRELVKRGWLERSTDKIEQLRLLLQFFGVASKEQWHQLYDQPTAAFRKSAAFVGNTGAVASWLRRGEILAQRLSCAPYNAEVFRRTLHDIRNLTVTPIEGSLPELSQICAAAGVAVVFVAELPKTHVCGATRWLSPHKALIQLSFRYNTADHLWFTFFHEAGHILLHGKRDIFLEGAVEDSGKEEEANRFSENMLIPPPTWTSFVRAQDYHSKLAIEAFALEQGIAPGIVVGRLQHEKLLLHNYYHDLKRAISWRPDIAESESIAA